MKKALLVIAMLATGLSAQAQVTSTIKCENHKYRDSRFEVNPSALFISSDAFVTGTDAVQAHLENSMGLEGRIKVRKVGVWVSSDEANCSNVSFAVSCSAQDFRGTLVVEADIVSKDGAYGEATLRLNGTFENLKVGSSLTSSGATPVLGKSVSVKLNNLTIRSEATFVVDGQKLPVAFTQNFETDGKSWSSCSMK